MRGDDLLSAVFPAQTACQENVTGDIEVPDHPLVQQTVDDCLHEAADLDGLVRVLQQIESGAIEIVGLDSREPSPFAHELLNANPFAFLDDAPLEERRARAVAMRRSLSVEALRDLGRLDPEAIAQVASEAWPLVRDADELHDVLLSLGALPADEGHDWSGSFDELRATGRATVVERASGAPLWTATERWPLVQVIWPNAEARAQVAVPRGVRRDWPRDEAIVYLVRGRIECTGPMTAADLARVLGLERFEAETALAALEAQGQVLRGQFTGGAELEWCDRRLLARIHRMTLDGLRRQIAPVSAEQFLRFLLRHQHVHPEVRRQGQTGLLSLIEQFEGFHAPAGHWEKFLLPGRMVSYDPAWLDALTFFGQAAWGRLRPMAPANGQSPNGMNGRGRPMKALTRSTPITLMLREDVHWLLPAQEEVADAAASLGGNAQGAYEAFLRHGALFPAQLGTFLQLLPSQVDDALGELAAAGLVTSDGYPALRALLDTARRASRRALRLARPRQRGTAAAQPAGRWTLLRSALLPSISDDERNEHWCRLLLRRYGVVFRDLLANESAAPPWQQLVRTYRRLEARGEIRGGRFVAGVGGEQYALPEAIPLLRSAEEPADERPLVLPATDPLNLTGRIDSGARVPALPGHSIRIAGGTVGANEPPVSSIGPPQMRMTAPAPGA
jgi:ATP-dependent Lhr-like helicase